MFKFKVKLDWNHILQDLVVVGLAGIGALVFLKTSQQVGLLSYNGLSSEQVNKTYRLFLKHYDLLSMVKGYNPLMGGTFVRGVAIGKGGFPMYYHYSDDGQGNVEFNIYPEFYETWTTSEGIGGIGRLLTGHAVYP